jgi:predicted SAM-dependent methyltransferase
MQLDIGCGDKPLEGYIGIDRRLGGEAYPLKFSDGSEVPSESAEVVRASHVLEHFGHQHIRSVLQEWVRALSPGGVLKIAVPDFAKIVAAYKGDSPCPIQAYLMGGQTDDNDQHRSVFDRETLYSAMDAAGLIDIEDWQSEANDCAALPISLNLQGMKPRPFEGNVKAVMSVPRLGFMDNLVCWAEALLPLGIKPLLQQGAYWGQCLERGLEQVVDGTDWLLVLDYDSFFTANDIRHLLLLAANHPEADAIAPLQMKRGTDGVPLMTRLNPDGSIMTRGPMADFRKPMMRVHTSHFGCTLIRVSALVKVPHPWFKGEPNAEGRWGEGRIDDDIWFWKRWADAGNSVYSANQVAVGHGEYTVLWPDKNLRPIHQLPREWRENGTPKEAWL